MKLTPDQLADAADLAKKNPIVKALLEHYNFVTQSQVYESLVARLVTLQQWNADLSANPVSILSSKKAKSEDLEDVAKKDKEVDRILKFMEKQPDLIAGTAALRAKLLPQEEEALLRNKDLQKTPDLAFG